MELWKILVSASLGAVLAVGCGDDGGSSGGETDAAASDAAEDEQDAGTGEGEEDAGFDAGFDAGSATFPPRIQRISVQHAPEGSCNVGTASEVRVTISATDPDTPDEELTYSGSIDNCEGEIDAPEVIVQCDEAGAMGGIITVTDPEDNSDNMEIAFDACMNKTVP